MFWARGNDLDLAWWSASSSYYSVLEASSWICSSCWGAHLSLMENYCVLKWLVFFLIIKHFFAIVLFSYHLVISFCSWFSYSSFDLDRLWWSYPLSMGFFWIISWILLMHHLLTLPHLRRDGVFQGTSYFNMNLENKNINRENNGVNM